MNRKDVLFIICCILAIIIVIVYSILSAILFKREQAIKSPYYFCDGSWECCSTANCDVGLAKGLTFKSPVSYKPSDNWKKGSLYHQNCVLPIQNAILNYSSGSEFNYRYIYEGGSIPTGNPSVYAPGCAGPGGTGVCADPTVNPQNTIGTLNCPYVSFDSLPQTPAPDPNKPLPNGTAGSTSGATLNYGNWANNTASPYISGFTDSSSLPGNNYSFPYTGVSGSLQGQYTGGNNGPGNFYGGNTHNNALYSLPQNAASYTGGGNFV